MRSWTACAAVLATTVALAACESKEVPAQQAVASAEQALAQIREDAATYAPEQLASADADLNQLKADLAQKDYKKVLAAAPRVNSEVGTLTDAVIAKQTQVNAATQEWDDLNAEVPRMVDAIDAQVSNLPKAKQAATKTDVDALKSLWAEATAAFSSGDVAQAADKGRTAQAKGKEVMQQLGMTPI